MTIKISDTMRKVVRLTEGEFKGIVRNSIARALKHRTMMNEQVDNKREVVLAQKIIMKMSPMLSELGLRLDGTRFTPLYKNVKDSLVALNNALIEQIRGGKQ